jgi:hypothetical protein
MIEFTGERDCMGLGPVAWGEWRVASGQWPVPSGQGSVARGRGPGTRGRPHVIWFTGERVYCLGPGGGRT